MFVVILFITFYLACVWMINQKYRYQQRFLIVVLGVLTLLIGFRDNWPDELPYVLAFQMAPYPWDFFRTATPDIGYTETGYFFLASVVKMGYNCSPREKGVQMLTDGTKVFPAEIFDPFQGHSYDRSKSYCLHLANGSWRDPASGSQVKIGVFEKILIRLLRPLLAKMHYSIFKY
ncbi:MAG: hypothetical protein PUD15_06445 [Prevotella sp.]|nr:hypothetical protein [Prevotella sp.]